MPLHSKAKPHACGWQFQFSLHKQNTTRRFHISGSGVCAYLGLIAIPWENGVCDLCCAAWQYDQRRMPLKGHSTLVSHCKWDAIARCGAQRLLSTSFKNLMFNGKKKIQGPMAIDLLILLSVVVRLWLWFWGGKKFYFLLAFDFRPELHYLIWLAANH